MSLSELIPLFAVALTTLAASVTDLWKFKVYNVLTLPTLILGVVVSAILGGWSGFGSSLLGAALGFGLLVVFFAVGGVGAGDVKLLTAVGAWLGPYLTYQVFIASALFGGIYALILVFLQGGLVRMAIELVHARQTLVSPSTWKLPASTIEGEVKRSDRRRRLVPYAAMTCLGYLATIAWWGSDLRKVWHPTERSAAISTVSSANSHSNQNLGGAR
jgi:prepilin peptidase CpaA